MKADSYYGFFSNLSNKTKMAIIAELMKGPLNSTEIARRINEEQSKVSHSLRKLAHCKILDVKRQGKQRIYSLNEITIMPIMKTVEKHLKNYCKKGRCNS